MSKAQIDPVEPAKPSKSETKTMYSTQLKAAQAYLRHERKIEEIETRAEAKEEERPITDAERKDCDPIIDMIITSTSLLVPEERRQRTKRRLKENESAKRALNDLAESWMVPFIRKLPAIGRYALAAGSIIGDECSESTARAAAIAPPPGVLPAGV